MPDPSLQWLVLDDFSPGIQNKVLHTGQLAVPNKGGLGAAVEEDTYRCIALPTGGLGPLPMRTFNYLASDFGSIPISANIAKVNISGGQLSGPILDAVGLSGPTQAAFYIAFEYYQAGGVPNPQHKWKVYQFGLWDDPTLVTQIDSVDSVTVNPGTQIRGTWFTDYRTQLVEADESIAGYPVIVYSWYEGGGGNDDANIWHMFPSPVTPTAVSILDLNLVNGFIPPIPTLSVDKTVGHQGRYVGFEQTFYFAGSATATWSSDEQIYFSNTNLYTLFSTSASAFGYEKMTGFGAVYSTSTDELFCVKHKYGALTVNGPMENPTIVWLPGVTSTGGYSMQACYTPIGVIYGVKDGGVYAWAGGDNSNKISAVLEDDFFECPGLDQYNQYRGQFAYWDDWIITPNNWLYDYQGQGWWRLEDPDEYTFFLCQRDIVNNYLFTAPVDYTANSDVLIAGFQKTIAAHDYSWKSQPFSQTMDQSWKIREVVIKAQGVGQVQVTLVNIIGSGLAENHATLIFDFNNDNIATVQRATWDTKGFQEIQMTLVATGDEEDPSAPAPIIHEVRLGWMPDTHLVNVGPSAAAS